MISCNIVGVPSSVPLVRHFHQNLLAQPDEFVDTDVPIHLRELRVVVVDHVFPLERGTVLVEPIRNEHRYIVEPRISRCCTQQDPVIPLRNPEETLRPCATPNQTLLIEYEEAVLSVLVLPDVVPRVDGVDAARQRVVALRTHTETVEFFLPVE